MAENKKSFILYADTYETVKQLPDDVAGRLFKHIFLYVNDKDPVSEELILNVVFEPIKQYLKRDLKKWGVKIDQKSDAGTTSAFNKFKKKIDETPKKKLNLKELSEKYSEALKENPESKYLQMCYNYLLSLNKNQQPLNSLQQTSTKSTVSVSVSVSDSDNVSVSDNKNIINNTLMSEIKISDLESDKKLKKYFEIAEKFRLLFIKNLEDKNAPITHQEKAKFKNYVDPIRLLFERDKATKEQLLKVYFFLDNPKGNFWKKNILSTSKLRDKFDTLCIQAEENNISSEPISKDDGNR